MQEFTTLSDEQLALMRSPIFSIDHVQIPIHGNLYQAAKWYQSFFGVGDQLPGPHDDAWFAGIPTGRGNLFLWKTDDANSKASFSKNGHEVPVIMFKTFQIDILHEQLLQEHVTIVSFDEPTDQNLNQFRFLKFYDPWGNMLGFIQDPPAVPWYGKR